MENKRDLLIVDDIDINRIIIAELFSDNYNILEAENGEEALKIINSEKYDFSIILLDLEMPIVDGLGVLRNMKETGKINHIPVVLITSDDDDKNALESYGLGVSDVVHKPFNSSIVLQRVQNVIDLYAYKNHLEKTLLKQKQELIAQGERIKRMNFSLIDTLSATVEFRNVESGKHIMRTRLLIKVILESIRDKYSFTDEQLELISSAAALHDVGKIAIPDAILLKPGKLTEEEFEIMKEHTVKGSEILETLDLLKDKEYYQYCYDICRHHHERWDGAGYPDGLVGFEIPIWAQAASLVDVYDALTSKRVYKDAYSHEQAIDMILNGECGVFNPDILKILWDDAEILKSLAEKIATEEKNS
ncbi:MAG: response regulator [Clostridiales Family XIII bacterium]|nr:response regulator [Clostridiales Family XIII bacterium]